MEGGCFDVASYVRSARAIEREEARASLCVWMKEEKLPES